MPEVEEFRTKIEAIKKRLSGSDAEGNGEILELKERLGTVRDSLQNKQETIDSQLAEIAELHEENAQLSDMLDQALTALEAKSEGGIKEIVQSIDSEFANLLSDSETQPGAAAKGGDRRGAEDAESQSQDAQPQESKSGGSTWDPENESVPALQRIMGRHKN